MRRGAALPLVLLTVLVLGMLATGLMTRTTGSRRQLRSVRDRLQRELALDAAFEHAFHLLKDLEVSSRAPLPPEPLPPGEGILGGVPYTYTAVADPRTRSVRIEAVAGDATGPPPLRGAAVALVEREEEGRGVVQRWRLTYTSHARHARPVHAH